MTRFASLKNAELKLLLTAVGAKTGGTKPQLLTRLEHEVQTPRHFLGKNDRTRILSIDMGIKNMAFCVCDARKQERGFHLDVKEWRRIAVLEDARLADHNESDEGDPFGPSALSSTAHRLVRDVFLPQKADTILIERQRFRSGSGSAVQEWTLRVNMFESMIWAIFRALYNGADQPSQHLWPINPKQVANFWISGTSAGGRATAGRAKIEKKQKIDLVKKWLSDGPGDRMSLEFSGAAAQSKHLFLDTNGKKKTSPKQAAQSRVDGERIGKLDDLADSLLQATAWCRWEENRTLLKSLAKEKDVFAGDEVVRRLMEG